MPDVLIGGRAGQGSAGHITLDAALANRHGLVAGTTGTGKTVTLQVLARGILAHGGAGVCASRHQGRSSRHRCRRRTAHPRINERLNSLGIDDWQPHTPVRLWDLHGKSGHAVRASVASMGPELMASLLELNETQGGLMHLAFDHAEREGLELVDLKDLIGLLKHIERERDSFEARYGSVSPAESGGDAASGPRPGHAGRRTLLCRTGTGYPRHAGDARACRAGPWLYSSICSTVAS